MKSENNLELGRANTPNPINFQAMDSNSLPWRINIRNPAWQPPTDVYETETTLVVRVEIAGMRENDFVIELNGRILNIRGIRQDLTERRACHQMEIRFGEFSLELELPLPIKPEGIEAVYNSGFLRISLPKAFPQHIEITEE